VTSNKTSSAILFFESGSVIEAMLACDHLSKVCPDLQLMWIQSSMSIAFAASGSLSALKRAMSAARQDLPIESKQSRFCLLPRPSQQVVDSITRLELHCEIGGMLNASKKAHAKK